jgi:hypothetical protein
MSALKTSISRRDLVAGTAAFCTIAVLPACVGNSQPAFVPGEPWLDDNGVPINAHGGGVLHFGTRWYWFGEHKVAGQLGNTAQVGVHVYSSSDLIHWRDEGIALTVSDDPGSLIARGSIIERPKVLYNATSKSFVMWFHLELKGQGYAAAHAGVAVAETVTGPYRFLHAGRVNPAILPMNHHEVDDPKSSDPLLRDLPIGQMARDFTLFVDDRDDAWHVYSSEENNTLHAARLTPDYLEHDGRYWRVLPKGRNEAPAIFRARGRYYMITSGLTGWLPNEARSFVADAINGPWTPLGNPIRGTAEAMATTFGAQSTFVLRLPGSDSEERFVFMADIWCPENAIDGRYVWLPIAWEDEKPVIRWRERWTLKDAWPAIRPADPAFPEWDRISGMAGFGGKLPLRRGIDAAIIAT